jgi:peptidoglycan hydrolase CwlO-like protein
VDPEQIEQIRARISALIARSRHHQARMEQINREVAMLSARISSRQKTR